MEHVQGKRYKRTLFVGLGGAGAKTLRILKKRIQDANKGKVPKQIKFLLIDTNATELSNFRDFDSSEKICIAVREPYQRYTHDKGSATHEFIPKQNAHSLLALERGAGQIRSNGHFAVIENQYSNKLMRIFRERADELEDIDVKVSTLEKDPKIEVRLVFSIAGGTGSGTFLPIATILRAAIKHSELTAYIYSATNFSKKVENSAKYSVMQNAYAALCELDYMMHFGRDEKRHKNISFNFGPSENQHMEQSNRPFEEVYYIDKHTSFPTADSVEFSYNEIDRLQENTADAMHLAATNIISAHTGTVDNVRQKIMEGQFDVSDKFAWVSGMGLAELYFNKLDNDNPKVISACLNSIEGRTDSEKELETSVIESIATDFMSYKYDESRGKDDKDPILSKFIDLESLHMACVDRIKKLGSNTATSDDITFTLENIVFDKKGRNVNNVKDDIVSQFKNELTSLLINLIDNDSDSRNELVKGYTGQGTGLTLDMVRRIIEKIQEKLEASLNAIGEEKEVHKENVLKADTEITTMTSISVQQPSTPVPVQRRTFLGIPIPGTNKNTPQQIPATPQPAHGYSLDKIHSEQVNAIENKLLAERDQLTIDVLQDCFNYSTDRIAEVNNWKMILRSGHSAGVSKKTTSEGHSEDTERKVNRVEVQMVDIEGGFRIKYSDLKTLAEDKNGGRLTSPDDIFTAISRLLMTKSGSLQKYLAAGIDEINTLAKDGHVKVERTECQQKIDRLIDLSSPTMQVDAHGYGEQVKVDHFWYVMTDCPEANVAEKPREGDENSKTASVGGLLKLLIEQNTLDAKINLVHVPGWDYKAKVYRVDSAVPAYFVDGVCESTEGGHTLEGCYEELKKTKRTYTPFSHETLRSLLENKVCALKPMDTVEDDKVLDYWLNFILYKKIVVRGIGDDETYCIDSEKCGERLSDQLDCRNHVLVLGKTRTEAYNTFQRYCGELIKEWKTYEDDVKNPFYPVGNPKKNAYQIVSCDYLGTGINGSPKLSQYSGDISKLEKEDEDFIILDREMTRLDKRALEYAEEMKSKSLNETLSNCDGNSLSEYCNKLKSSTNID